MLSSPRVQFCIIPQLTFFRIRRLALHLNGRMQHILQQREIHGEGLLWVQNERHHLIF